MKLRTAFLAAGLSLACLPMTEALTIAPETLAEYGLGFYEQGGALLPNSPTSDWFYGCSPTAAGMAMGFYDRSGYGGMTYGNLIPGGVAPAQSIAPAPSILKSAIASLAHVNHYYSGALYPGSYWNGNNPSYTLSGDDTGSHAPTSLADFMGTSQDSIGNVNGGTTFFFFTDGAKLHYSLLPGFGLQNIDGMYGITEYVAFSGYGIVDAYTQLTSNQVSAGFTLAEYKSEIDAGRPVMVHVEGHTMLGVGYDDAGNIQLHNTWDQGTWSMAWGGSYSGMPMWGVTAFELTGGSQNIPDRGATLILLALGLLGLRTLRRRRA